MRPIRTFLAVLSLSAACVGGQTPSRELVDARAAYARASQSAAATEARADLAAARRALRDAEHAYSMSSSRERHLAVLAKRHALLAIERAQARVAEREAELARIASLRRADEAARAAEAARAEAEAARQQAQSEAAQREAAQQQADVARMTLEQTEKELADTRSKLAAQGTNLDERAPLLQERETALQAQLDKLRAERDTAQEARNEAERQRDQALAQVRTIATVTEEDRGMVITLPGEVMFRTNEARLLRHARTKLDDLAEALQHLDPNQSFVIEGHTDARGSAAYNRRLSRLRANAVRAYLVKRGVDPDRIVARGVGEEEPVASNADAEGRANNRRVEIVVSPSVVTRR